MKTSVASLAVAFAVQALAQERTDWAAPPLPAQPAPPEAPPPKAEGYGKQYGVLGNVPLVFGPKLTLGFIQPATVGIEAKYANLVGLSVDYGFVPEFGLPTSTLRVAWSGWNVGVKVYPFRGSFFLGAALGGRSFTGKQVDASGNWEATVSSTYLAPELGWRWVARSGLFFGMEFGWQFVLSYTTEVKLNGALPPSSVNQSLHDAARFIGEQGLPHLGLFTIGYLF